MQSMLLWKVQPISTERARNDHKTLNIHRDAAFYAQTMEISAWKPYICNYDQSTALLGAYFDKIGLI